MWDEVKLSAGLTYDTSEDRIIGTEEWGSKTSNKLADHAMVFGIHGIDSNFFFPLAFGYCEGSTDSDIIVEMVQDIVHLCKENNFEVIATVCDQGSTNSKAVYTLVKNTDRIRQLKNLEKCKYTSYLHLFLNYL